MSKDSSRTHLHLHASRHADLFEDFTRVARLAPEDVDVPPALQPPNPEDEDDVVPDQHAAFGIQRATQRAREPAWRDFGLEALMRAGPSDVGSGGGSGDGGASMGGSIGGTGGGSAVWGAAGRGLPR